MTDVKWIKLAVDIFDNRKIKQIEAMPEGDALIVIWLKLLVLAGNVNDGGMVYFTREIPYTDQLLSVEFKRPLTTVQLALATFQKFGMIEIVEDIIHISNWERYQNIEGMDRIREQNRLRKQRQRERERLPANDCHVTVTGRHATDIDIEREIDKEIDKVVSTTPPTLAEVEAYCRERKSPVDPARFFHYYQEGDWKDANGRPVQNWKQKVIRWEKDDAQRQTKKKKPMDERDLQEEDYETGYYTDIMNRPRQDEQ